MRYTNGRQKVPPLKIPCLAGKRKYKKSTGIEDDFFEIAVAHLHAIQSGIRMTSEVMRSTNSLAGMFLSDCSKSMPKVFAPDRAARIAIVPTNASSMPNPNTRQLIRRDSTRQ